MANAVQAMISAGAAMPTAGSRHVVEAVDDEPTASGRRTTRSTASPRNILSSTVEGGDEGRVSCGARGNDLAARRRITRWRRSGRLRLPVQLCVTRPPGPRGPALEAACPLLGPCWRTGRRTPGRQPHDLVHHLVGDRAQDEAVVLDALVAGEVERRPKRTHGTGDQPTFFPGGATTSVPLRAFGITGTGIRARAGRRRSCRGTGGRCGSGCPRPRCRQAAALRILLGAAQRARGGGGADARSAPDRRRRRTASGPALDARGVEVLRLRHEVPAATASGDNSQSV